jgi:hypothetical protein
MYTNINIKMSIEDAEFIFNISRVKQGDNLAPVLFLFVDQACQLVRHARSQILSI